jgi:hypothetical protein
MQIGVGPAEGDLDAMVQVGNGRGGMHQEPAPDERADRTEPKAKLKDGGDSGSGMQHLAAYERLVRMQCRAGRGGQQALRRDYTGNG